MPDSFYLDKEAMIFLNGLPINGVDKTYLSSELEFKFREMRHVTNTMEFKNKLGERLPGEQDDILVIFNEDNQTFDRVNYSDKTKKELVLASSLKTGDTLVVAKMLCVLCQAGLCITRGLFLILTIWRYPAIRVLSMKL